MELQVTYLAFVEVEYNTPSSLDARPAIPVLWEHGNEVWLKQGINRLANAVEGMSIGKSNGLFHRLRVPPGRPLPATGSTPSTAAAGLWPRQGRQPGVGQQALGLRCRGG